MNNVEGTQGVPLTVFGGAVPELAPEDLPEGASPFNQDVDFNPGSVFTRGGRANQVAYLNFSQTKFPTFAASIPGQFAPNEVAWANPTAVENGTPGVYASAEVNRTGVGGVIGPYVDFSSFNAVQALTTPLTGGTTGQKDLVIAIQVCDGLHGNTATNAISGLPASVNNVLTGFGGLSGQANLGAYGVVNGGIATNGTGSYTSFNVNYASIAEMLMAFPATGAAPVITQVASASGAFGNGQTCGGGTAVVPANVTLLVVVTANQILNANAPGSVTITDNHLNTFSPIGFSISQQFYAPDGQHYGTAVYAFLCTAPAAASNYTFTINMGSTAGFSGAIFTVFSITNLTPIPSFAATQILQTSNFNFSIPSTAAVLGFQLLVTGHQTNLNATSLLTASPINAPPGFVPLTFQLPTVDSTVAILTPLYQWGLSPLTAAMFNNPAFGFNIYGQSSVDTTFAISGIQVKVWLSPNPPGNINWLKTYEQTNAQIDTLFLDSNGIIWDEQVNYGNGPASLNAIFQNIFSNTFAKSVTFDDIEYIAFSNLLNGTDVPRQWNGTNMDRISMVGPGAACNAAAGGGAGGSNSVSVQSISQAPKVQMRRISWGASINAQSDSTPGNVLVVSLPGGSTHGGNPPLNMNVGDTIVLSSITNPFPLKGGGSLPYNLNGTYKLLSSGTPIIGGGETDTAFTLQAPAVAYGYSNDFGVPPTSGWFYQDCVATVTLQNPLPNVGPGNTIQITGTGGGPPGGYDGTWTVLTAPNASSMTITSVILVGGVATYSFTLAAGSAAPQVGQFVAIANVLNANPAGAPGIFNTSKAQIQSVSGNTFSIAISNADITPAQSQLANAPPATAQVAGTIFTFDVGQAPINGGVTVTGGTVIQQGQIAIGARKVCYSFLTRSGYITQPSPISPFNVTSGSGVINISNLATGPPNVVARIVFFTGANGGNFFYIPQEVDVVVAGQPTQVNTSTIVNDNISTTAQFSFSDAVLLAATAIDIPGNNLFNTIELGSCRGLMTYAQRMIAWGEQTKVTNLRNLSFDGGTLGGNPAPLGWTLDPTNGTGGSLNTNPGSPSFGWGYQISNTSGSTQASWGMILQPAYQDEFGVPIFQASTAYSVRIAAQVNPVPASGNLVVDLINGQNFVVIGQFVLPLNSMSTNMQLYSGTLVAAANLQPVPPKLFIRVWANNIPTGTTILIDRVEPFQTLTPAFTTALKVSYANNQEAFDLNTGLCGPAQNQQPINGAMELFDLLYALKEKSWFSTFDNGVTEPFKWNWKEVSNKVGAIGQNAFDWGEGWALTADREGVHFFEGGEPIKVSQEIQPLWDAINWQYGYSIWLRNDPEQRRFTVGVPIPTPQQAWLPEFPVNTNPTSPNVILMCNYRELNTGSALAATGPIRSTYTGRLMSPEPARKWSFWNIVSPYSDYISRASNNWPQWFGTGYFDSKVFQLNQAQLSDDGLAVNSFWVSYGFVKAEMQDAKGLGLYRMEFPYLTVLVTGVGTLNPYVYPESPLNRPYALDPLPLPSISQGDMELGVNIKGNRFFIRVGTNAVGSGFRCSKLVVPLIADPWSPVRGYNAVTA